MDSKGYLKSYGWVEGEALKNGGLKKPILVKHKKDTKGLGHDSGDGDAWWERLFDGQLKSLDVLSGVNNAISFKQNDIKPSAMKENESPLYKMFVKGEGLAGTVGNTKHVEVKLQDIIMSEVVTKSMKVAFSLSDLKKDKKARKEEKKLKKLEKEKSTTKRKRSENGDNDEREPKKTKRTNGDAKDKEKKKKKSKKDKKDKKHKKHTSR